jgi:hypothetical protein
MIGAVLAGLLIVSLLSASPSPSSPPFPQALFAQIIEPSPKPPIEQSPSPPIERDPKPPIEKDPKPPTEKQSVLSGAACRAIDVGSGARDLGRVWCPQLPRLCA